MAEYSAIIAGGGPAGSAAAIALARAGHAVLVVERSRYEGWRIGETLPPEACLPLEALGVWEKFQSEGHLRSHAIHAVWGDAKVKETDFIYNPYGTGWHLDRRRFDRMLADEAERLGAIVAREAWITEAARENGKWRVHIEGTAASEVRAAFLIDATGRASRATKFYDVPRLTFDRMVGMAAVLYPGAGDAAADPLLLLEAAEEGWWYSAPLSDGGLIVTYLTDADLLAGFGEDRTSIWKHKLQHTTHTEARTKGFCLSGEVRVRFAGPSRLERASGEGWIAAGDAAAAHDPISADGITKALYNGLEAARAIQKGAAGPAEYARNISEAFDRYMEERREYYRWETRWPDSIFWQRRQTPPQVARAGAGSAH